MNSKDALERLTGGTRGSLRSCSIPDCHSCMFDREAIERLEADARALADMRTLDDWRAVSPERTWLMSGDGWSWCRLYDHSTNGPQVYAGEGATPDEARAKAAAWVREQTQKVRG
jgi:hypothetical protein